MPRSERLAGRGALSVLTNDGGIGDRRRHTPKVRPSSQLRRRSDVDEITGSIDNWRTGVVDLLQWKTDHPRRLDVAAALAGAIALALINWPGNALADFGDLWEGAWTLGALV